MLLHLNRRLTFRGFLLWTGVMPGNILDQYQKIFQQGRAILKRGFGLSEEDVPVVIFRATASLKGNES